MAAKYYANIVQIDDYIGQIIDKAKGIWGDDLYIVFTADHGDMMGNHSLWGKNSCLYNDVIHIPLVVHHPRGCWFDGDYVSDDAGVRQGPCMAAYYRNNQKA